MYFYKKQYQYRYISAFIILCMIMSCLNISAISTISDHCKDSDFPHSIYTTTFISSSEDACTPEMLGRQTLNSYAATSHKTYGFSHTHKTLSDIITTIDTIHSPLYHSLFEHISNSCEPASTASIISYIHLQDGKKKNQHNFLSMS